jgi:surface polysaccharide O-acyltransferase-like enzyme
MHEAPGCRGGPIVRDAPNHNHLMTAPSDATALAAEVFRYATVKDRYDRLYEALKRYHQEASDHAFRSMAFMFIVLGWLLSQTNSSLLWAHRRESLGLLGIYLLGHLWYISHRFVASGKLSIQLDALAEQAHSGVIPGTTLDLAECYAYLNAKDPRQRYALAANPKRLLATTVWLYVAPTVIMVAFAMWLLWTLPQPTTG